MYDSLQGEMPVPMMRGRTLSDDQFGKNNRFQKRKYVQPIATVFFRFSHRNKKNQPITNQEQKEIIDNIYQKMTEYLTKDHVAGSCGDPNENINRRLSRVVSPNHASRTYLNFYDPIT